MRETTFSGEAGIEPYRIAFGGYQPAASVHSRAARIFGATLQERTGSAVAFSFDVDITETGQSAAALLEQVESGAMEMCYFASSYLAARVPELALLDLPFVIEDRARAYRLLDGKLGSLLARRVAVETGYRVLGFWDNGFRHFSNAVRPIHTPADCRGLRIRTLASDLHRRAFAMLGFTPVTLDVRELRQAVAEGRVDAQENPLTSLHLFGLHHYHRHITLSGHFFGVALLLCNAAAFERWSPAVRQAVTDAAAEATAAQRGYAAAEDDRLLAILRQAGNRIVSLDHDERRAFANTLAPLIDEQRQLLGKALFATLS